MFQLGIEHLWNLNLGFPLLRWQGCSMYITFQDLRPSGLVANNFKHPVAGSRRVGSKADPEISIGDFTLERFSFQPWEVQLDGRQMDIQFDYLYNLETRHDDSLRGLAPIAAFGFKACWRRITSTLAPPKCLNFRKAASKLTPCFWVSCFR